MFFIQLIAIIIGLLIAYNGMGTIPNEYKEIEDPEKARRDKEKGYVQLIIGIIIIILATTLL